MIELAACAVIGALGNRIRGGVVAIPGGTQVGRLVGWGIPCALVAWLAGAVWWAAGLIGIGAFVGCMAGQYGGLSMGHRGPPPDVSPWATMTAWGVARVIGPALVAAVFLPYHMASYALLLSGLICAPIYYAVWLLPARVFLPYLGRTTNPENPDPPQLAEAIHGAVMMAALYLAVAA